MEADQPSATSPRYCIGCGYVLDGLPSQRCPECGRVFSFQNPRTFTKLTRGYYKLYRTARVLILAAVLLQIELLCSRFVWETAGEMDATLHVLLILAGNFVVAISVLFRSRAITLTLLIALLLLLCPIPIWLQTRLSTLQAEARRIIAYLEETRSATGEYPATLAGYQYQSDWTAGQMRYTPGPVSDHAYWLSWWVLQPGVSHWYTPEDGFDYYPD